MASTIDVYAAAEGCNEENMQRELAENAVWKQIQKNTFTRWCNEHLKCVNKRVAALETDLSDGLRLIALLEVLSQKKTKKYNKRPNFRQMKLENVSVALNFLEQEHIKLVSIDSKAIVDGNLKLILGLIWTLILHYSISMPMWDDEEEEAAPEKKATPKQRLLGWMQNKIPQMPVTNFKGNWQDGTALGALVDNLAPGLCPDWEDWKPEDGVNNTAEAMKLADDWLGVPQVITPEEITNPNVDELSVMTYLSQFPKAQLKPGAPLRPKTNSKKARAYGKGVEPNGCKVGVPAPFTVETHSAGHGDITVSLKDPHGNTQDLKATPNNDKLKTFAVSYFPTVPGVYEVSVTFAGSAIQKSPFKVNVDDSPTDPDSVTAIGPGLESGNVTGSRAHFEVFTAGAGLGEVDVVIENPTGCRDSVRPKIEKVNDDVYMVTYTPNQSGPHKVNITFAGIHIPKSPFEVPISLPFNPDAVWADGPGVEAEGVTVRQTAKFTVHTEKAGDGKLEVKCIGPRGVSEVVNVKDNGDGTYACDYHPLKTGQYVISVTFGGKSAANSPYRVNVDMPPDASKVKVQGPGIGTGNIINEPTYFDVLTADAGKGAVDATITLPGGKGEIPVHIEDRGNGTVRVSYTPKECGIHKVKVNFAGQEIPKSPYNVEIHPSFNPNSCRVYGRGIQPTGLRVREKAEFHISTKGSGDAKLKVNVKPPRGSAESVTPKKNRNEEDVYDCEYFPTKQGNYTVEVTYGGKPVPKSPFLVAVGPEVGQQKVRAYGPGLDEGKVGHSADFVVEAIGPDVGKLGFSIEGPSQAKIECEDKGEGSCDVKYFPTEPGEYAVHVMCDDVDIKGSPFMAQVAPADSKTNPDKVVARGPGLESGKPVPGTKTEFTLDARKAGEAAPVEIYAKTSDGDDVPVTVKDNGDGTYQCEYKPLKPVKHTIIPSYDGVAVKGSPFRVAVADTTPDVSKVRVYGPGLTKGTVNKPAPFTIDTTDAGDGGISLTVEGPCEPKIECIDNGDCTCSVSYLPTEPGDYKINVKFADEHVPGSPFAAEVEPAFDITKVRMRGPGLESGKVGKPSKFEVDHKKAGEDAPLAVEVTNEDGSKVPEVKVKDNGDGTKGVTFVPNKPGKAKIDVQYGGVPLVDSPITVPIKSDIDTSGVRTSGPGVEPKGVLADVETDFKVNAKCLAPRGGDHLEAKAVGPSGNPKPIDITDNEDGTYDAKYAPTEQGPNKVFVEYDGVPVPGSPFPVQVKEGCDSSKVKAYGPGLEQATTNKPAKFVVDTRGAGTGGLGLSVEGPSDAKITCSDGKDGTCAVEYLPVVPGDYQVNVTYGDENIPGSPFKVNVADVVDPTKVKCEGPGISSGVRAAIPQEFTVDCTKAGVAPLEVAVKGPRGITETVDIEDNDDGTHTVKYTPTKEGTYQVQVKYADEEVPKSPYRVRVLPTCDASKVKCTGPGVSSPSIPASLPVEFIVDTNDAGEGVLALHITNPKREKYTAEMPPASTKPVNESNIAPTSRSPATKSPIKSASGAGSPRERRPVKGGAGPVKRSPVKSGVGAAKGRRPVKEGKISPTKRRPVKSSHDDDAVSDDEEEPREVQATDPDGNPMDAHIRDNGDGTYTVEYVPDLVGRYTVSVKYGDDEIPSSPYRVRAVQSGDAGKCVASGDGLGPNVGVGEESVITVDANDAGPGKVTCAIAKPDGKPLDSEVVEKDDGTFDVFYTPHETGTYPINIQFGGEPIPDSPWKVKAEPAGKRHVVEDEIPMSDAAPAYSYMNGNESVDGPDAIRPVELTFEVPTRSGELTSEVITPSKRKDIPKIKENDDGTITVQYKPTEKGLHEMSILLDDEHISGSPIQFYADAMEPGHVTAYGPGLVTGKVNEPADFTIVTKDAGAGGLGLAIEGPSKAEITCADNQDGTCSVSYLPTAPGEYSVSVKFDDEHIAGSPFTANISGGPDRRKSKLAYGTTSDVSLNIQESDLSLLRGSIESPSGKKDDCILKKLPNGHIGISFTPKEIGEHMVSVKKRGRHVANSPFRVMVGESEIGDASKVKVYGEGCEKACEKERAEFNIDTRNAGFGGLGISVEGPSKVDIDCEDMQDGICKVTYEPQEAGNYTVNVKFADKHVPGSPFSVKCEGDGSKQKESITKQQKAAPVARVGSTCDLNVKIPDAHLADLTAEVRSPSGHKDAASVVQSSENTYTIRFVPKELGVHTVTVKCMGHEVPGSPFQFTVGPLGEGGAGKVTAHGPGLERAEVNLPAEFSISTREAGAGGLAIAVEGPSKADINFDDQKDGSCLVTYVVTEPGDYEVSVKFNDEHIPGSCFPVHVTGVGKKIDALTGFKSDASKVRWYGDGLRHAKIGEENVFTVDCGSAGSNMLLVGVHGPEIPCEEVMVKHIGQQRYTVTYTANQPGAYLLIVKWGEDHIPGSPFHVTIP